MEEKAVERGLRERLEVARAKVAAGDETRRIAALIREVEKAELEAQKAELEPELDKQYGPRGEGWDWVPCYSRKEPVAVRRPHPLVWQEHRDRGMPDNTSGYEALLYGEGDGSCLVMPDKRAFEKLRENEPGILDMAALTAIRLSSSANESLGKK